MSPEVQDEAERTHIKIFVDITLATLIAVGLLIFLVLTLQMMLPGAADATISMEEYSQNALTGDLIVFSGENPIVRISTRSPVTHVGMVIVHPSFPTTPFFWEANVKDDPTQPTPPVDLFRFDTVSGSQLLILQVRYPYTARYMLWLTLLQDKLAKNRSTWFLKRLTRNSQLPVNADENLLRFNAVWPLVLYSTNWTFNSSTTFWVWYGVAASNRM